MSLLYAQVYPRSALNLNPTTKQIDIDVYTDTGVRVDVTGMQVDIDIIIERMKSKNPEAVTFKGKATQSHPVAP